MDSIETIKGLSLVEKKELIEKLSFNKKFNLKRYLVDKQWWITWCMAAGVTDGQAGSGTYREEIDTPRVVETSRDDIRSKNNIGREY